MASLTTHPPPVRKLPTRSEAAVFSAKAWGLRLGRWTRDLRGHVRRWPRDVAASSEWVRGHASRTPLWCEADPREQALERGKVENLRLACARLDGCVVEAGGVFSFWRQLGRADKRRGFMQGRMLQQGCVIPAIGGGLCQLSNALYELALRNGCEIVERHAHSARLPGMPLHDATVAWNYIDLRFRMRERIRVRTSVTDRELVVWFETAQPAPLGVLPEEAPAVSLPAALPPVHSCATCGEAACFRHRDFVG